MLTPTETAAILAQNGNPADYVVMPVDIQIDPTRDVSTTQVPTPNGPVSVVLFPMVLAFPVAGLRMSRLLDSSGRMPHPLTGSLPMLTGARLVLPRERLTVEMVAALDGAANGPMGVE